MNVQATSSLDTETEQSIQDSLNALGIHRTVVIIAHRLTTVQNADLIIVLENGKVVEQGNHVELLSRPGGRYAELVLKKKKIVKVKKRCKNGMLDKWM